MFNLQRQKFILDYYSYKLKNRILTKIIERTNGFQKADDLVVFNHPSGFNFSGQVVFDFSNPKIIHLGDQLFYQPIIEYLSKKFRVIVLTYPAMKDYFSTLGYLTLSPQEIDKKKVRGSVLISNEDFLGQMKKNFSLQNIFIGINYASPQKPKKVVELVFNSILKVLKKTEIINLMEELAMGIKYLPMISPQLLENFPNNPHLNFFLKNPDKKFILFNNYVFSNFLGVSRKRKRILENLAYQKKKQGYLIIHTGSRNDKEGDKKRYGFVDYDLRGKINPIDLFKILSLKNVKGVISFDTFVLHAASLLNKQLYIVLKGRGGKGKNEKIKKVFVPMASNYEKLLKFIY